MTIAPTLQRYLDRMISYDVVTHTATQSSMRTAEASHISGDCLAKGIVLRRNGSYMLAVLPASHHIRLSDLRAQIGNDVDLAAEREIDELFQDCARGAIPAVGECYELDTIVDNSICDQPEVYMEAGDHMTLVHMKQAAFARLTADAWHGRFSVHD
jgi:Ala-tRNA(Pro) deacylase